jgi:hypothetical protein
MLLALQESLPSLVAKRFAAAKDAGALVFSATQLAVLSAGGVHVSLFFHFFLSVLRGLSDTDFVCFACAVSASILSSTGQKARACACRQVDDRK